MDWFRKRTRSFGTRLEHLRLSDAEKISARDDGRQGEPPAAATQPSQGEHNVIERILGAKENSETKAGEEVDECMTRATEYVEQIRRRIPSLYSHRNKSITEAKDIEAREFSVIESRRIQHEEALDRMKEFKDEHGLHRDARTPNPNWLWVMVVLVVLESAMNAGFFWQGGAGNQVTSFLLAFAIAALNVFILSLFFAETLSRVFYTPPGDAARYASKTIGVLGCIAILGTVFVLNLGVAHYRDAITMTKDVNFSHPDYEKLVATNPGKYLGSAEEAALVELRASLGLGGGADPFLTQSYEKISVINIVDDKDVVVGGPVTALRYTTNNPRAGNIKDAISWFLMFVGLTFWVIGVYEWWSRRDPYPGYAEKRQESVKSSDVFHEQSEETERRLNQLVGDDDNYTIGVMEQHRKNVEAINKLETRLQKSEGALRQEIQNIARAGESAVEEWRTINRAGRHENNIDDPEFWNSRWELDQSTTTFDNRLNTAMEKIKDSKTTMEHIGSEISTHHASDTLRGLVEEIGRDLRELCVTKNTRGGDSEPSIDLSDDAPSDGPGHTAPPRGNGPDADHPRP